MSKEKKVELIVNGKEIELVPFVESIIKNAVEGMVKELKNCENAEEIILKIQK